LLFVGPSGVGKKQVAQGVAQSLVCESLNPKTWLACGRCGSCIRMDKFESESLKFIEPDNNSIKMTQAKEVLDFLSLKNSSRAQIVIIDDAHLLNPQAANALLKTIEEPPENVYFFLLTSSYLGVLPTIRSRSQRVNFSSLSLAEVKDITRAEDWVVNASQGRIDLAKQLNDPVYKELRLLSLRLFSDLMESSGNKLSALDKMVSKMTALFKDKTQFLFMVQCMQQMLRDVKVLRTDSEKIINYDFLNELKPFTNVDGSRLDKCWKDSLQLERDVYANVEKRLAFENFVLRS